MPTAIDTHHQLNKWHKKTETDTHTHKYIRRNKHTQPATQVTQRDRTKYTQIHNQRQTQTHIAISKEMDTETPTERDTQSATPKDTNTQLHHQLPTHHQLHQHSQANTDSHNQLHMLYSYTVTIRYT